MENLSQDTNHTKTKNNQKSVVKLIKWIVTFLMGWLFIVQLNKYFVSIGDEMPYFFDILLILLPLIVSFIWQSSRRKLWKRIMYSILLAVLWVAILFFITIKLDTYRHENFSNKTPLCPPGLIYNNVAGVCKLI